MARTTLIRHVTDNIQDRRKNAIHSAYASGKTFTGATLFGELANLNTYVLPGVVRIGDDVVGTKPPISNCAGFLVNMTPDQDLETDGRDIRQIIYPDSETEPSPYTRVGTLADTGNDHVWGEWTTLGGGMTHRELTEDTEALPGMMYYSFGNFNLTLLDPSSFSLGTKIGLIQFAGTGSIIYGEMIESTHADYAAEDPETAIGGLVYMFEICADAIGTPEWVLENDNNVDGAINAVQTYATVTRDALNIEISQREALAGVVATKHKQVLYYSVANERTIDASELVTSDIHLFCTSDSTVILPTRKALSDIFEEGQAGEYSVVKPGFSGSRIIVEISPGVATLIVENNGSSTTSITTNLFIPTTDNTVVDGVDYYLKSENVYTLASLTVGENIPGDTYHIIDPSGTEGTTIVGGQGEYQTFAALPGVSILVTLQFSAVGGSWEWVHYTAE